MTPDAWGLGRDHACGAGMRPGRLAARAAQGMRLLLCVVRYGVWSGEPETSSSLPPPARPAFAKAIEVPGGKICAWARRRPPGGGRDRRRRHHLAAGGLPTARDAKSAGCSTSPALCIAGLRSALLVSRTASVWSCSVWLRSHRFHLTFLCPTLHAPPQHKRIYAMAFFSF